MIHRCDHCGADFDMAPSPDVPYIHIECANAGFYNEIVPVEDEQ